MSKEDIQIIQQCKNQPDFWRCVDEKLGISDPPFPLGFVAAVRFIPGDDYLQKLIDADHRELALLLNHDLLQRDIVESIDLSNTLTVLSKRLQQQSVIYENNMIDQALLARGVEALSTFAGAVATLLGDNAS